jgi:ATP-dependent helicase/nuclease subunit B
LVKFLEQAADFILNDIGSNTLQTAIIFPNKRSEIFLKNHLKKKIKSGYWLPDFFTIDEFIVQASGQVELDPVNVYFELYKIHKDIAGKETRSLDEFLAWAPIMLADFTDIDLYLANAENIFTNLSEIKAIQQWNPSGQNLTPLQKNYLTFYNSLYTYYASLKQELNSKGLGYKGMIYRHLCENIDSLSKSWTWKRFVLVGFNALSESEKKVFGYLIKQFDVDVLFDADDYFMSNQKNAKHEAGRFINELIKEWDLKEIRWKTSSIADSKQREIKVLGIPKKIGQVKYAAQKLEEWMTDQDKNDNNEQKSRDPFMDTAVVLADEKLLIPLLNSLPQIEDKNGNKIPFNITMGYPLKNSSIGSFALGWLSFLQSKENSKNKSYSVKSLLELLNNPFFRFTAEYYTANITQKFMGKVIKKNAAFLPVAELNELLREDQYAQNPALELIMNTPKTTFAFIDHFISYLSVSKPAFEKSASLNHLMKEQMIIIMALTKKLKILFGDLKTELSFRALEKIFTQLLNRSEINLKGEPLSGIQVMGMLETRNLDFEKLIILSANDGILPRTENLESFIPFDVRRNFNLPLPKDKSDVFAYHFFRLLKRAEKVQLVYNSEPDALGGGEKSRYLLQLEKEILKGKLQNAQIKVPLGKTPEKQVISIEKTAEVVELVKKSLETSLSPTAMSAFISCPLKFYFKNIIGLRQAETLESDIEAHVLGKVIHGVLEDIFSDFIGQTINVNKLRFSDDQLRNLIRDKFKEEFAGGSLDSGQNLLTVEVANKYLADYLKSEIRNLTKQGRIILGTEEKLDFKFKVSGFPINLNGTVDRVDEEINGDTIRIVDYKTGRVDDKELKIKEMDDLINNPDFAKAFQVFCYAYLYTNNKDVPTGDIEAGIVSMRKLTKGFFPLQLPENGKIKTQLENFEQLLFELIERITDPAKPFDQTEDEERCKFCDYKDICNRNPGNNF